MPGLFGKAQGMIITKVGVRGGVEHSSYLNGIALRPYCGMFMVGAYGLWILSTYFIRLH